MKKYGVLLLLLLLTGCKFYDEYKMPEEVNIELNENKLVDLKDFIKEAHRLGLLVFLDLVYFLVL